MEDETELLLTEEAPEIEQEEQQEPEINPDDFSLDDDPAPVEGEELPNHLRKLLRDAQKDLAVKTRRLAELEPQAVTVEDIGPEPLYEDYDYDPVAFQAACKEYNAKAIAVGIKKATTRTPDQDLQDEVKADVERMRDGLAALPFADREDVLATAEQVLPDNLKFAIAQVAKDSATVIYALAKSPQKAQQLIAIKNPLKLAAEVALLEEQLKMRTSGKKPPAPASSIRGNAVSKATDAKLEAAYAKAERTGDYSEYHRIKREMK